LARHSSTSFVSSTMTTSSSTNHKRGCRRPGSDRRHHHRSAASEWASSDQVVELRAKIEVDKQIDALRPVPRRKYLSPAQKSQWLRKQIANGKSPQEAMQGYMALP